MLNYRYVVVYLDTMYTVVATFIAEKVRAMTLTDQALGWLGWLIGCAGWLGGWVGWLTRWVGPRGAGDADARDAEDPGRRCVQTRASRHPAPPVPALHGFSTQARTRAAA